MTVDYFKLMLAKVERGPFQGTSMCSLQQSLDNLLFSLYASSVELHGQSDLASAWQHQSRTLWLHFHQPVYYLSQRGVCFSGLLSLCKYTVSKKYINYTRIQSYNWTPLTSQIKYVKKKNLFKFYKALWLN